MNIGELGIELVVRAAQRSVPSAPEIAAGVAIHVGTVAEWAYRREYMRELELDIEDVARGDRLREAAAAELARDVRVQCQMQVEDRWRGICKAAVSDAEIALVTGWAGVGPTAPELAHSSAAVAALLGVREPRVADAVIGGALARCWVSEGSDDPLMGMIAADPMVAAAARELPLDRFLCVRTYLAENWDRVVSAAEEMIASKGETR